MAVFGPQETVNSELPEIKKWYLVRNMEDPVAQLVVSTTLLMSGSRVRVPPGSQLTHTQVEINFARIYNIILIPWVQIHDGRCAQSGVVENGGLATTSRQKEVL